MPHDDYKPLIAITMGDPCGIGGEVIAKALASGEVHPICRPVVVGSKWAMAQAVSVAGVALEVREVDSPEEAGAVPGAVDVIEGHNLNPEDVTVGRVSAECGRTAMEWVTMAAELALARRIGAIATAPVNKEAARLAGYEAIGHMELLQHISGAPDVATMLLSGRLRVVHLTTHRSLRRACDYVTRDLILAKLELTHHSFGIWGAPNPRIGVAALNPHGSDGGLMGEEEENQIAPAIAEAGRRGIDAQGPVPADIVFHQAINGTYDVVLAMYHDQGHIAIKVHGFEASVSANLGLPFVRTSVDHGTAFDIAGKGIAHHTSMVEAIKLAVGLSTGSGLP